MAAKATFADGSVLKNILKPLSEFATFAYFAFTTEGLTINAQDSANIARMESKLNSEFFDEYECEGQVTIGVHLADIVKCLKFSNNDCTMTFSAKQNDDMAAFKVVPKEGIPMIYLIRTYLETLVVNAAELDLHYLNEIKMPSKVFAHIIRDLSLLEGDITIYFKRDNPNELRFTAKSPEGSGLILVANRNDQNYKFEISTDFDYDYNASYLASFAEGYKFSSSVSLKCQFDLDPIEAEEYVQTSGYLEVFYNITSPNEKKDRIVAYLRFSIPAKIRELDFGTALLEEDEAIKCVSPDESDVGSDRDDSM